MKPRIALPYPHTSQEYGERALPQYTRALEMAGAEPVVIPLGLSNGEIAQLAKSCHGVLLPGSPADVDPEKYGEAVRHPRTAAPDPARDNLDELLLQDAHAMRKPIFGICYGIQALNVWRSGTLVQHLETAVKHTRFDGEPRATVVEHLAAIAPATRLAAIVASALQKPVEIITVNSSHHQAVAEPGDGLRVVARSPQDGVIEAVEGAAEDHWVLGVQWHPERTAGQDAVSAALFAALAEAARKWREETGDRVVDFESLPR